MGEILMKTTPRVPFRFAVAFGLLLTVATASVGSAADESAEQIHRGRISAVEADRRAKLQEAEGLYAKGSYKEAKSAVDDVLEALEKDQEKINSDIFKSLQKSAETLRYNIMRAMGKEFFRSAQESADNGRYDEAKALASQAAGIDEDLKADADSLIKYCEDQQRNAELARKLKLESFDPQVQTSKKDISQLLLAAQVFMDNHEPMEALKRVEQAMIIDPANPEAIEFAGRIYNNLYAHGSLRRKSDLEGVYTQAIWQWVEPVFPKITGANPRERGSVRVADSQQTFSRLDGIIFPQIEFDEADVGAVLDWIARRSANYDPQKRGVTINKSNFGSAEGLKVSLSLKNIPMSEAIRYICQQTNLKYRVDSDSVMIGPEVNEMVSRRFTVPSSLVNFISESSASSASEGSTSSNDDDGGVTKKGSGNSTSTATAAAGQNVTPEQWIAYFEKRGIKFPEGTGVSFIRPAKTLIVRNTPENLHQLDVLLRQLEMVGNPPLIMVEIKSIEVTEEDYQELGFEWSFGNCGTSGTDSYFGSNLTMTNDGKTQLDPGARFGWLIGQGVNTLAEGVVRAVRGGAGEENPASAIINNWNLFPTLFGSQHPFGSDLPINISLTINAMDQNTRTETLSAPKVITANDTEATVKLGKTYYFPESWDDLEIEVDSSDDNSVTTITPPVPSFPQEGTEVGINFSVKPKVLPDNRTIRMHLAPSISIYEGDDEWDITIKFERLNPTSRRWDPAPDLNQTYTISKPIIAKREMEMTVDLDNGETVVLGGLVHNETAARLDKVPILGDLPLIGRLFQNSAENTRRVNLLFFVTARLISYDGVPIERDNIPGVPDFNR